MPGSEQHVGDCLTAEGNDRRDLGVDGMTHRVLRGRSHGQNLILRSSTCHAAKAFSADVSIIDLDLSPKHIDLIPIAHDL
jgi:hypothetical protein